MRRTPILILFSGVISFVFGGILLLLIIRLKTEQGLIWFAVPIMMLGFTLIAIWTRDRLRRPGKEIEASLPANPLPGRWYPWALIGILVLLAAWFVYWTKFR